MQSVMSESELVEEKVVSVLEARCNSIFLNFPHYLHQHILNMIIKGFILLMVLTFYLTWNCTLINAHEVTDSVKEKNLKYCGGVLADTLRTICKGNYPTFKPVFRHKKTHKKQDQMAYGRRRRRRGVFSDCCEQPCSIEQLSMYCAEPSTSTSTINPRIR